MATPIHEIRRSFLAATPTERMKANLIASSAYDPAVSALAVRQLAKALELPLRRGLLQGNNYDGIFETQKFEPGQSVEYPIDFLSPNNAGEFRAYTIPKLGALPQRSVEGDYLMIPTYEVGNTIDWPLMYSENARWDIVARALQVLEAGFTVKNNIDAWRVIISMVAGRNMSAYDSQAVSGLFTKRLIANMQTMLRRNSGGGNYSSLGRGKLTDVWVSPEGLQDVRAWDVTQIDEVTRRDIFLSDGEVALTRVFGVTLHPLDEFGEGQAYTKYYTDTLGGTFPTDKVEIVVGLDLLNRDCFIHPVRKEVEIYEDANLFRERRAGFFAWGSWGWSALTSWRGLLGAF